MAPFTLATIVLLEPRLTYKDLEVTFMAKQKKRALFQCEQGVTLIEVLVGMVLITVISLTTLNYFAYGKGNIARQSTRRAALERARERLEQLMAARISEVVPPIVDPELENQPVFWISCNAAGTCTRTNAYVPETVSVDEKPSQKIESTVQWKDDPNADTVLPDTLELGAKVWFTSNTTVDNDYNRVYVKTLRTP